ncbi:MAG: hypothetical protein KJO07_07420, partial [Deltaproteobacteria bacterium]|nr:hypothetical protein [Deltaproteobacteria bacterium]
MSLSPLPADAALITVYGASEPFAAWLCAAHAERGQQVVVITPSEDLARRLATDIRFFRAGPPTEEPIAPPQALHLPALDVGPYVELSPDRATLAARMSGLYRLSHPDLCPDIVVLSVESLTRRALAPAELEKLTTTLSAGGEIDRDGTAELLVRAGYARTQVVEDPGTFAVRGGVIDLFPSLYRYPIRIELFGDEVESIRTFDPDSQRTLRALDVVHVHPVRETIATTGADLRGRLLEAADRAAHPSKETRRITSAADSGEEFVGIEVLTPAFHAGMASVSDYLDPEAAWFAFDPDRIREHAADLHELAED